MPDPPVPDDQSIEFITANSLRRTFLIRSGPSHAGTGFTVDVSGHQFLVTAKHVLRQGASTGEIEVFHSSQWKTVPVQPIGVSDDTFDAIALKLPFELSPTFPLTPSHELILSQDLYFLGFPFGLFTDQTLNKGFPVPFVKKATLSAFGGTPAFQMLFLDGINNPGFSGGPIISLQKGWRNPLVVGVISAYRYNEQPVYLNDQQLTLKTRENTGIIIGCQINPVMHAIAAFLNR
jgi:S1-C subfamily serine protease